jgi:cytochrome c oxidase subunit II
MEREGSVRRALPFLLVALTLASAVLVVAGRGSGATSTSLTASPASEGAQDQPGQARLFTLTARKYAFNPARIEVYAGDLVKITLEAQDIPHSFTIDAYRIAKRAAPGRPAVFEFRADQAGTFPYYCNLTIDEGCRQMRGELVVRPRPKG